MRNNKRGHFKGDWIELLKKYFQYMGADLDEQEISSTPKDIFIKKIKDLIRKAAFRELTEMKDSTSKIKDLTYETFTIQSFLRSPQLNSAERNILYSLRSRMHPAKIDFR